ncbi:MAG: UDP-N-acetylmuramate dehydrogenase [Bacillota bacterium]|nr:UDP-N-acetylmuramate dehydrogenase [Bacillota bacterium]
MDIQQIAKDLQALMRQPVLVQESMSAHTTWKIGGPADLFLQPSAEEELQQVLAYLYRQEIPWLVIGNGSNLLVGDRGIRGAVIKMGDSFSGSLWRGQEVEARSGMLLSALALEAAERSLGDISFARGIPGSVGGAVRMNAGAYGGNIGDFVTAVYGLSYSGEPLELRGNEISFAYRNSSLFDLDAIVTRVRLRLKAEDREELMAKMKDYARRRSKAQPLEYPSCGSVFRNPASDHAGRLVEITGLRGLRNGNAAVSQKHGNFIINLGGATAAEVRELIELVQEKVYQYAGILLEPEVRFVGEF